MMTTASPKSNVQTRVAAFARQHVPPRRRPAQRKPLVTALALGQITPALAALYSEQDGLMIDALDVFDLDEARQHPANSAIRAAFPGAVLFGWDRSGYLFFEDAEDSMGRGHGAIFAVDKIYVRPGTCVLCAPDLAEFLERSNSGRPPWFAPRLIDQQTSDLRQALKDHHDRVETRPPKSSHDIAAATKQAGIVLGMGHLALLRISDGLLFPTTGLEIYGVADLRPILSAGLCRFGGGPPTRSLAITGVGAERPVDLVLEMSANHDAAASPSYGRVLDVVTRWVRGDGEDAP